MFAIDSDLEENEFEDDIDEEVDGNSSDGVFVLQFNMFDIYSYS